MVRFRDREHRSSCTRKHQATRIIAGVARVTEDIAIAEELAQDVLVVSLEGWPKEGIPSNPGSWLMTAAKHRAIDALRRGRMLSAKHEKIIRTEPWLGLTTRRGLGFSALRVTQRVSRSKTRTWNCRPEPFARLVVRRSLKTE